MTLKYTSVLMKDQIAITEMIRQNAGITEKEVCSFYPHFKARLLKKRIGAKALLTYRCNQKHLHLAMYKSRKEDLDKHNRLIFRKNLKSKTQVITPFAERTQKDVLRILQHHSIEEEPIKKILNILHRRRK